MKRKRWQDRRRKQKNGFWKSFTSELRYSAKNSWKECPPEKYGIM